MNESQQQFILESENQTPPPAKAAKPLISKIFQLRGFSVLGISAALLIIFVFMIMPGDYFESVNLFGGIIVLTWVMLIFLSIVTLVFSFKKTNASFKVLKVACIATLALGIVCTIVLYTLSPNYTVLEMINLLMPECTLLIAKMVERS